MPSSIYTLADTILDIQSTALSNLQLQKLTYFCYGIALAKEIKLLNVENPFEAWPLGPVNRDLYFSLRQFQDGSIPRDYIHHLSHVYNHNTYTPEERDVIAETLKKIGHLSAFKLVDLSHLPDSPWDITFKNGAGNGDIIPDHLIQNYFSS